MLTDTNRQASADLEEGQKASFANPLDDKGGYGSGAPQTAEPLVEVPSAVISLIQLTSGGSTLLKARLWHTLALVALFSTGYVGAVGWPRIHPVFDPASIVWPVSCIISGLTWAAGNHLRWRAFSVLEGRSTDALAPQRHGRVLDLLQQEKLPADQAAKLVKWAMVVRVFVMCFPGLAVFFSASQIHMMDQEGTLSWDVLMALCTLALTWPSAIGGLGGGVLMDYATRAIIVERIRPIIERVRSATPASADFDDLLTNIVSAQQLVCSVSAKLERAVVMQIAGLASAGAACMFLGLTAHPPDVEHWWRTYLLSEVVLTAGSTWFIGSILMLYQAAKVSSVCEGLGDAINEMFEASQREPGGEVGLTLCMPTKDQQRDIESLRGYVRGLNRGRGMGFVIHRKRISHTFVVALAAKVFSVMAVSFPIILSLTRVEHKENVLLNHTDTAGCATP